MFKTPFGKPASIAGSTSIKVTPENKKNRHVTCQHYQLKLHREIILKKIRTKM
jgi:hypothetical protein